ncbi:MAG: geranylgeranylglyceryl/heptaprenylglyceryl phosphate synthase [Paludibacteraceae bacterium]
MSGIHHLITQAVAQQRKLFALLIDPEKCSNEHLRIVAQTAVKAKPDLILVGGSQLQQSTADTIDHLRQHCDIPIVLFPGNALQLAPNADALLLLSLISGRNAEWLIGQQVKAAHAIRNARLETIPTGYILIDGGKETAVQRISGTRPIAADNIDLITATALGGEQAGKQLIYLEAGSGALHPVPTNVIRAVKQTLTIPLIVGGGITTPQRLHDAYAAGADMVVVGNHFETHLEQLDTFTDIAKQPFSE